MKKVILGTVQFGLNYGINNEKGKPSFSEICKILDYSYSKGVRFLDSAEAYGNSHSVIGKYHKIKPRNKFKIITKFSPERKDLPNNIKERLKKNLEILNVENIYCYMFHSYSDFKFFFNDFKECLLELKKKKIINKIGVSVHSNFEIDQVLNCNDIDLIQAPFNLLDNFKKRNQIFSKAKKKGVEIHSRSVFLQGLFFKEIKSISKNMKIFKKYLKYLNSLVLDNNIHDLALKYVFNYKSIDGVLLGVDNLNQIKINLNSLKARNTFDDIFSKINEIDFEDESMLNPVNWNK